MSKKSTKNNQNKVKEEQIKEETHIEITPTDTETDVSDLEIETVQSILLKIEENHKATVALDKEHTSLLKQLKKAHQIELKSNNKRTKQRGGNSNPNKPPSGFAKPTTISKELCAFLEVDFNTQLARTDVTKRITSYIKEHDLQNPDNRREIRPDAKLKKLINMDHEQDNKLTYFNLQRCIKHHFPKKETNSSTTA